MSVSEVLVALRWEHGSLGAEDCFQPGETRSGGGPTASLTDPKIAVAILNFYADGHFQLQEDAHKTLASQGIDLERNPRARSQCLVRFEKIAALLVTAGHPETGPTALRRALAGVGVDAGNAGVLISGLEAAYERLAQGPLD